MRARGSREQSRVEALVGHRASAVVETEVVATAVESRHSSSHGRRSSEKVGEHHVVNWGIEIFG